jgi:hypothetical protein
MRKRPVSGTGENRKFDDEVRPDEVGNDPAQVGPDNAGQSGDLLGLSGVEGEDGASQLSQCDSPLRVSCLSWKRAIFSNV